MPRRTASVRKPAHPARAPRRRRSAAPPAPAGRSGKAEPVRLAAARAYLAFADGGGFSAEPPAGLHDAAQRRLYVQLLRGLVRHRRLLEAEVERLARRPLERIDAGLLALAMLGLFQLRFLDGAPHAAVYETVELCAALGRTHGKGFVNAILRAAQREGLREDATPGPLPWAVRTSHPDWLAARWVAHYGEAGAQAIGEANNRYEGAALRVEGGRITPQALVQRLAQENVAATPHPLLPGALWVEQVGVLLHTPAFREGLCYVQDVSSQVLLAWAEPLLRGRVLDACAAPGGKLTHLLGLRCAETWAVGGEPQAQRLLQVRDNLRRLRVPPAPLLRLDGRRLPFAAGTWDAVLVDAPCSATGMIRKYPELKWRKHEADLAAFAQTQAALLEEAARVLRSGGTLVYVTCSLESEENEDVVAGFLARHRDFSRHSFLALEPPAGLAAAPRTLVQRSGDLRLLPAARQMGLYAALLRRRGSP